MSKHSLWAGVVVAVLALGVFSAPASAAGTASISGAVTGSGISSGGWYACAYVQPSGTAACGNISTTGTYKITGLAAGSYKIQLILPGSGTGTWKGMTTTLVNRALWYSERPGYTTATVVTLTAGQQFTAVADNIDVTNGAYTWPKLPSTARVGATLTATPGVWPTATALRYAWYANGTHVADTSTPTFTPTAAQLGKTLDVTVYGYTGTLQDGSVNGVKAWQVQHYTMITTVGLGVLTAPTPTVSGTVAVGFTLTAKHATWTSGTTIKFAWLANGVAITGATASTFKLTSAQIGKAISVRMTGTQTGYTSVTKTSAATPKVALTAVPTISGTLRVGDTLTAHPGTWTRGTTFTYQWYANGGKITGATHSTFRLTSGQRGKRMTVKVTGHLTGYATVTRTSASTGLVS